MDMERFAVPPLDMTTLNKSPLPLFIIDQPAEVGWLSLAC